MRWARASGRETLGGAVPALAQRTLLITDFAADVRVNIDGTIDVSETIRAQFNGTWNGLYRTIPVDYRTPQGFNYMLRLDVQAVTDAVGNSLRYESSRERNNRKLKIYVPGAVDASRTASQPVVQASGITNVPKPLA